MGDRTVRDVVEEFSAEQTNMLHFLVGTALVDGTFKALGAMAQLRADFFTSEQSRVVYYLMREATDYAWLQSE